MAIAQTDMAEAGTSAGVCVCQCEHVSVYTGWCLGLALCRSVCGSVLGLASMWNPHLRCVCRCELVTGVFRCVFGGQKSTEACRHSQVLCLYGMCVWVCVNICVLVSVDEWRGCVCCEWASVQLSSVVEVHRCEWYNCVSVLV